MPFLSELKHGLQKLVTEWDESIHMEGKTYWKIDGIIDPKSFFLHLPKIFPLGRTLLFEGEEMGLTATSWYEQHPAIYMRKVACDQFSPIPAFYHVTFTDAFAEGLCQIIASQGLVRAFYHFKGYSEREILFTFHDAFEGALYVSNSVDKSSVDEFAASLGKSAQQEIFPNQLEKLRAIDRSLNPPWWKRLLGHSIDKKIKGADKESPRSKGN
jgi:hypothetical protein